MKKFKRYPNPNPNGRDLIDCPICKRRIEHYAKGHCKSCYTHKVRKKILVTCPRCKRLKPHHAKGLCNTCYLAVYQIDKIKASNAKRYFDIDYKIYQEKTKKCIICGFDKIVELHHINENKKDNSLNNLVGLCPNHHKMIHNEKYRGEIMQEVLDHVL